MAKLLIDVLSSCFSVVHRFFVRPLPLFISKLGSRISEKISRNFHATSNIEFTRIVVQKKFSSYQWFVKRKILKEREQDSE